MAWSAIFVKTTVKLLISLVGHLVNDHDELWGYEKTDENALRRIVELEILV